MSRGETNTGKKAEDEHLIRFRVENVKDLDLNGKTQTVTIDGSLWELSVYRNNELLEASISCNKGREFALWEYEIEGEVKLVNQINDSRSAWQKLSGIVGFEDEHLGIHLVDWSYLGCSGFVVDGSIVVEAKIVLRNKYGERARKRFPIDFYSPHKYSDVILVVEGKKLHVSKQILANASTYFDTLFYGEFKESQEKEIELKDISAEHLLTVLELIYDSVNNINEDNVEELLKIAHQFDVPKIMDKVEKWLINADIFQLHKSLLLADKYGMQVFKARMMWKIHNFDDVTALTNSESYKHFSVELMDKIVRKMLELHGIERDKTMDYDYDSA